MYVLVRVGSRGTLDRVLRYLKRLGCWVKEFDEPDYRTEVTAEERRQRLHSSSRDGSLNPPKAWETCASFVRVWDWDSLGRGPWSADSDRKFAGECANPHHLDYISCPKWCTKYHPASFEALVYVAERVAEEHEQRARTLRSKADYLKNTELQYHEAIKGGFFEYKGGKFAVSMPAEQKQA